jgi:hypothetical protein
MTTPLEQANEKRTLWKIIATVATVIFGLVITVITKGKVKKI